MRESLRKSGVDIIGDVPWGMHFCQFYQTKEDLMDILIPYFKAGLENNELCAWVIQSSEIEEAKAALRKAIPDVDVYFGKGQIEVIPHGDWCVNKGISDSERVLNGWIKKLDRALINGYDGLRLATDIFHLEKKYWGDFADYEEKLDSIIGNYRTMALCTYSLDRCNATEIIDVVINHRFALIKRAGKWEQIESSRHKKSEEKIRNLANIVESSNDGIVTESLDGIITSWNKGAEQIYGYSAKEILGKPASILEPPVLVEETKELAELIKQGDRIHHYETLRLRKDGRIINVSLTLSSVYDDSDKLTAISVITRDITESKKAEKELLKSEERYRIVTEQTGQVVYEYDSRTDKSSWEGAIEEVTGYSFKEFNELGKNVWIKNIYPTDKNSVGKEFQKVRKKGRKFKEELRLRKKDGTCIYVENSGVCLTDHEGQPYGAIGLLKDITSAKLAKVQLRENEERYRIATEQTGQLVFDINLETFEFKLAGAVREVTGYNPEELENLDKSALIESVHPEDRTELLDSFRKSFEKEKKFRVEFRFRKKDGNYTYAENSGVWLDDEGKVYRAIGVIKNITEWKLAIEKVEASEKKYRSFIKNFHGIAFQLDENFIPLFLHGAVEEITGYSEKEFMSWVKWKDIILPDDLSFVLKEEKKIRSPQSAGYEEIEFRIKHRDGRIRWINEVYQKIPQENGKPELYQGTIYDVTERKETEKFLENIETARKKEIHHRIKNNLQVISSLLDLQAEKFKNIELVKNSEVLEAFKESQARVISMALIHEELYKGGGMDTLNFSSYIEELVENLFRTYRIGKASTSLNMDLEEKIFLDMDTAVPLGIIINELVSNALKYAFVGREDDERIQIKLCREEFRESKDNMEGKNNKGLKKNSFVLIVSDNGTGVPESFDLKNPEGLGIQLVTALVDQLEGKIELKRDPGTEFIIRFMVEES